VRTSLQALEDAPATSLPELYLGSEGKQWMFPKITAAAEHHAPPNAILASKLQP
jgi:hypothetical protein